jgi:drug/metabolite transporter (DMT)-like permease
VNLRCDVIPGVERRAPDWNIAAQLLFVVTLWGANNVGVKYQVQFWPPVFTVASRFLCAGALLLAVMRWTNWFGPPSVIAPSVRRRLWSRGATSLAVYIVLFVWALRLTSSSSVALFMGTSPVWALLWEQRPSRTNAREYGAACLALVGICALFLPTASSAGAAWVGNGLALCASVCWTVFSRQCRGFGSAMTGLELTGQTFWRAGVLLLPVAAVEVFSWGIRWDTTTAWLHVYAVVFSGLVGFGLWNNALQVWPTSRVFLFGNLIPVTTLAFAHYFLGEPITPAFWFALVAVTGAVALSQLPWPRPALTSYAPRA